LSTEEEIKQVFGHIKNLMMANKEIGMEPPPVSKEMLGYMESEVSEGRAYPGQPDYPASLEGLREVVGDCKRCKLHKSRKKLVFGEGSPRARLVFVGEGPGREEDLAGRPFVGEAGELLTRIIERGMGLTREDVYICNVVKCRPPGNRDPERDEIEACLPFLRQQINIIRPEVICTLGRISTQELLKREIKITQERGKWYSFLDIPLMPTYHPAYIVRNPSRERELKGQVWEDVKKIMGHLGMGVKKND
jgi:uracil-DNA glycosylase family 4